MLEFLGMLVVAVVGGAVGASCFHILREARAKRKAQDCKPRRGICLTINGVDDPVVVEAFVRFYDNAVAATSHIEGFHTGEIEAGFQIDDSVISENLRKEMEAHNYTVTDHNQ